MKRPSLALVILLGLCAIAHGQSLARVSNPSPSIDEGTADQVLATRAMLLLKQLDDDVIVYGSLAEFEESGKLARVSLDEFKSHLAEATVAIDSISLRLSDRHLKNEMRNALASYRDGAFWWQKVYQPRVINVSSMTAETKRTPADDFLMANTPYTVAVHWRQAHKFFTRAIASLKL